MQHPYIVSVTDPPYAILNRFSDMVKAPGEGVRVLGFDFDSPEVTATVLEVLAVLFADAQAAHVFCGTSQVSAIERAMMDGGLVAKPWCWVKQCPPPPSKGNWWPSAFEVALYAYRSGAWFGDTDTKRCNVWHGDSYRHGMPGKNGHPTQKPLPMMRHIVGSIVPPHGLAVDPFMGSGSTLVAAKDLGRKAVGIEIEERWCEVAADRVSQEVLNL